MRQIILPVGPQGAGKTTFCKKVIAKHPEIQYISRDEILIELFGTVYLEKYTGQHFQGIEKMLRVVEQELLKPNITLIVDCWTGDSNEREMLTSIFRLNGAKSVIAWHFTTTEEICLDWFKKRCKEENSREKGSEFEEMFRESRLEAMAVSCLHNYRVFQTFPVEINQVFDLIIQVDPLDPPPLRILLGK